jgi:glucose/arabinose dehydrogenase
MRGRRFGVLMAAVVAAACNGAPPEADEPPVVPEAPESEEEADPEPAPQPEPEPEPEPDEDVEIDVSVVASGLEAPWDVAFVGGRTFVTERDSGRLLELREDGGIDEVQSFPVDPAGEGGLLGLAVAPDGAQLYAYYTTTGDNRVVRFTPGEEPEPVLTGIPKARVHNGGRIAFGPDGQLYVGTGDAGDPARSQDPDSLAGKILRLTPDGGIPDDNPTPGSPVYASGIRNAQGLAWDDAERLVIGELGPDVDDAVLRVTPGSDQGWGPGTANVPAGERPFPDPIDVRQPPEASWSGVAILQAGAIPQWEGNLFVAALRGQRLWRYALDADGRVTEAEQLLVEQYGRLRQVRQAPDGALWVLTTNRDGRGSPTADDDRIIRLGPPP